MKMRIWRSKITWNHTRCHTEGGVVKRAFSMGRGNAGGRVCCLGIFLVLLQPQRNIFTNSYLRYHLLISSFFIVEKFKDLVVYLFEIISLVKDIIREPICVKPVYYVSIVSYHITFFSSLHRSWSLFSMTFLSSWKTCIPTTGLRCLFLLLSGLYTI